MHSKHALIITVASAALAAIAAVAAPSPASACGGYGPPPTDAELDRRAVRGSVINHLRAVRRGDTKTLTRLWASHRASATVTRLSPTTKRVVSITPIASAIASWGRTPDRGMKWRIAAESVKGNRATVRLQITWHGSTLDETLTLARTKRAWQLVSKRYRVVTAAPTAGGY